jgi:hypothetical protein
MPPILAVVASTTLSVSGAGAHRSPGSRSLHEANSGADIAGGLGFIEAAEKNFAKWLRTFIMARMSFMTPIRKLCFHGV